VFAIHFENATKAAAETDFSHSRIQGRCFHLAQAWRRKMQQLGLAKQNITSESEVGKWLIYIHGIPLFAQKRRVLC
jgi:hypothetical protein